MIASITIDLSSVSSLAPQSIHLKHTHINPHDIAHVLYNIYVLCVCVCVESTLYALYRLYERIYLFIWFGSNKIEYVYLREYILCSFYLDEKDNEVDEKANTQNTEYVDNKNRC